MLNQYIYKYIFYLCIIDFQTNINASIKKIKHEFNSKYYVVINVFNIIKTIIQKLLGKKKYFSYYNTVSILLRIIIQ